MVNTINIAQYGRLLASLRTINNNVKIVEIFTNDGTGTENRQQETTSMAHTGMWLSVDDIWVGMEITGMLLLSIEDVQVRMQAM